MTRSGGRPSAFHSRTALISRMAGSPRLTTATRLNAPRLSMLTASPAERRVHVVTAAADHRRRRRGLEDDVQYYLVSHDGRVDLQHGVAADRAGPEAGREDPRPAGYRAVAHRVEQRDRDARRRYVGHLVHVEVQLVGGKPDLAGQVEDHRLVGLVRHD